MNTSIVPRDKAQLRAVLRFPILPSDTFNGVLDGAKAYAIERVEKPARNAISTGFLAEYPSQFRTLVIALLIVVGVISFLVSAGKQVAAIALVLTPIKDSIPLGDLWFAVAIVGGITLSEAGVILFMLVGKPISGDNRAVKWIFWFYAVWCAALSVVGNLIITGQHVPPDPLQAFYLFAISMIMPALVLAIGLLLERAYAASIERHRTAEKAYAEAWKQYQAAIRDYEALADYKAALVSELLSELKRAHPGVGKLLKADPHSRNWLIASEYRAQQQLKSVDLTAVENTENVETAENVPSENSDADSDTQQNDGTKLDFQPFIDYLNALIAEGRSKVESARLSLMEYPDARLITLQELEVQTGISIATWSAAKNAVKVASNGHSHS